MRQLHVSVEGIHRADTELGDLDLTIDYVAGEGWQFREVTGNFLGINWLPKTRMVWQSGEEGESTTLSLARATRYSHLPRLDRCRPAGGNRARQVGC